MWATLRAYGRAGYREIIERHLDLAQRLAARVDAAPDLERLGRPAEHRLLGTARRTSPRSGSTSSTDRSRLR